MRILHVTDGYLPRLGGIELHVRDLATRQRSAADVEVLTCTAGPDEGPVPVRRLTRRPLLPAPATIRTAVERFSPDVVHAHLSVASPFAWATLRAVSTMSTASTMGGLGLPAVATVHSMLPDHPRSVRAGARLAGFPTGRVTLTAVSEAAARPLRQAFPAVPVQVLHNGIDPADWVVKPCPHRGFSLVSVGRLTRRKRHLALIRALAEVRRQVPSLPLRAVLVGEGPERSRIEAAVRGAGLADVVQLTGVLSRELIRVELATADAYVAPATNESFGIAALEARCAGLPVIGMAASGVGEFVTHEREGLLALDDADLAAQILRLALDPGLGPAIRSHNCATAPRMTWPMVLLRHQAIYALAMGRPEPDFRRRDVAVGTRAFQDRYIL